MIHDLREYFPLRDLATDSLTVADFVHLGATGRLPIYVLADGWHMEVWKQSMKEVEPIDPRYSKGITEVPEGAPFKASDISRISGPVRLFPETLARFEANPFAIECRFLVTPNDAAPEYMSEFRLVDEFDGKPQAPVALDNCTLVVMRRDLPTLDELVQSWAAVAPQVGGAAAKVKRKAPDAFVKALIRLLVEIGRRAEINKATFDVNSMPGRKEDLRAVACKFDERLDFPLDTFKDYLSGLCQFVQGEKRSKFYADLFPEYKHDPK